MPGLPIINWGQAELIQGVQNVPVRYVGSHRAEPLIIRSMGTSNIIPQYGAWDEFESDKPVLEGVGPFTIRVSDTEEFQVTQIEAAALPLHYRAILE